VISVDQALSLVLSHVATLGVERAAVLDAVGRVLAEEIRSPRDIPGFDNSAMDGYAVRAADVARAGERTPVVLRVVETIGAGRVGEKHVGPAEAARIMTGAPVPSGADAIVPVERTRSPSEEVVEIMAPAERGAFVRPKAEDLRTGEVIMEPGKRLRPSDLGMLASLNRGFVEVYRRPRVAIVSTGDELVDIDQVPTGAQVVNSSAYGLACATREAGGDPSILRVARDEPEEIRGRLAEAAGFDVALSTGGVSVGQFDHVKTQLGELGMRQIFHGVAQKPGRPLAFGLLAERPFFGLPGNPVSTMVCFYLYARPALLKVAGRRDLGLPRLTARCAVDIRLANGLTEFVRVALRRENGEWLATPTGNQGSNILSSLARADGLLIGPASQTLLRAGTQATVLLLEPGVAADCEPLFEERHFLQ
jgi:molybdopterin molybdotransferase